MRGKNENFLELKVAVIDRVQDLVIPRRMYLSHMKSGKSLHNIHQSETSHLAELFKALQQQWALLFPGKYFSKPARIKAFLGIHFTIQPVDLVGGWNQF
jgi:hypothetical protein